MSGPYDHSSPDDDLLAFASAVGNFQDLAAESHDDPEEVDAGPGIFDFESAVEEPPEEASAAREPERPSAGAIVPILGMRMEVDEVDLGFARLIRAGALEDAPKEIVGASYNVFAAVESVPGPQGHAAAAESLARAATTLRLLKRGGVGLGAYGWSREATTWRRFSTGAGRPRPGGFELSAQEAEDLSELAAQIELRAGRTPAFAWALSRFDLGAERPNQIEALSDYLLAVRGLLDGGGPAKAGLSARVGALCAGAEERDGVTSEFEHALALERKMMSGDRIAPGESSPVKLVAVVEETLRTLLRGMVTGELGSDLRVTADEVLLADGLRRGGGSEDVMGGTAEWRLPDHDETAEWQLPDLETAERIVAERGELTSNVPHAPEPGIPTANFDPPTPPDELETEQATEALRPGETPDLLDTLDPAGGRRMPRVEGFAMTERSESSPMPPPWLEEKTERELEWPSFAGPRPKGRKRRVESNERIEYLFPKADLDWSVGEMTSAEQRRRRRAG